MLLHHLGYQPVIKQIPALVKQNHLPYRKEYIPVHSYILMDTGISFPFRIWRSIIGVNTVVSYTDERMHASSAFFTSKSHCFSS